MTDQNDRPGGTDAPRSAAGYMPGDDLGTGTLEGSGDEAAEGGVVAGDALLPTTIPEVVEESNDDAPGPRGRPVARPAN